MHTSAGAVQMTALFLRKKLEKHSSHLDDSNQFHIQTHSVLKLHSKVKAAWKMLDIVNFSLYHDTAAEILQYKPTFDQQKQNLIVIENFIEKIYQCGLTVAVKPYSIELRSVQLANSTKFREWNEIATQVNKLLETVCSILSQERDLEKGASFMAMQGMETTDTSKLPRESQSFSRVALISVIICCFILSSICMSIAGEIERAAIEMKEISQVRK
jgi:hypothetical protein